MAEQPKPPPEKSRMVEGLRAAGPYLDLGMTFVVAIGGGAWLGNWADQHWGTAPWLLLAGAMLGIVVGFYHFFSVVLRPGCHLFLRGRWFGIGLIGFRGYTG